jgi:hypothetical protein
MRVASKHGLGAVSPSRSAAVRDCATPEHPGRNVKSNSCSPWPWRHNAQVELRADQIKCERSELPQPARLLQRTLCCRLTELDQRLSRPQ